MSGSSLMGPFFPVFIARCCFRVWSSFSLRAGFSKAAELHYGLQKREATSTGMPNCAAKISSEWFGFFWIGLDWFYWDTTPQPPSHPVRS